MRIRTLDDVMQPLQPESLEQWRRMRQELIENIRFASSVDLLRHDAPLNAQVFDAVEYDGFAVEKVILQTLPGFYLCGNLCYQIDSLSTYSKRWYIHISFCFSLFVYTAISPLISLGSKRSRASVRRRI